MSADVLTYPTKRRRPYAQPDNWWRRPLPDNVVKIHEPERPPEISVDRLLLTAMFKALTREQQHKVTLWLFDYATRTPGSENAKTALRVGDALYMLRD